SESRPCARATRDAEPRSAACPAAPRVSGAPSPEVRNRGAKSTRSTSSDRSTPGSFSRSRRASDPETSAPSIVTFQRGTSRAPSPPPPGAGAPGGPPRRPAGRGGGVRPPGKSGRRGGTSRQTKVKPDAPRRIRQRQRAANRPAVEHGSVEPTHVEQAPHRQV